MADYRRIQISEKNDVTVVHFLDRKIIDAANIQDLGKELFSLVEEENRNFLLLDFTGVDFLSSAALNKLIVLDKKVKSAGGKLRLCRLRREIHDVFVITKLNKSFEIFDEQDEALKSF
jgi:anti-sigma B factor antagonist